MTVNTLHLIPKLLISHEKEKPDSLLTLELEYTNEPYAIAKIAGIKMSYDKDAKEVRNTHINIGTGIDISIRELAETIKSIVGYTGELYFDDTKPDGTMVKLTDPSKLHALGWKHVIELEQGIGTMYQWYKGN